MAATPQMRFWSTVGYAEPEQTLGLARATEDAGFHGITVPDHMLYPRRLAEPYPFTDDGVPPWPPGAPWPDAWCLISAMAGATTTLRFTTAVYVAPARPLHAVAHQVATAAVLSGARVTLGVGVGWMREEYEAHGQRFEDRGRRLDDMIPALRELWRGGWVEYEGDVYSVQPMHLTPVPASPVPIYIGGDSPPARRRAAELGDGWILEGPMPVEAVEERVDDVRRRLLRADRDPEEFRVVAMAPDPWDVDDHRRLLDLGVEDVVAVPWMDEEWASSRGSSLEAKTEATRRFADEVLTQI